MLRIHNLSHSYGSRQVLDGISLQGFEAGEVTALIGPNATGKSTFFRCLSGLLPIAAGQVFVGDLDIGRGSLGQVSKKVCYLPQSFSCQAALTVFEIVLLARKNTGAWRVSDEDVAAVESALLRLDLSHLSQVYVGDLSGGQQQMVSICQAMIRSPQVYLLDEPTSALDLRHQLDILTAVREMTEMRQVTTLLALHDLNLAARFSHKAILMKQGRVMAFGPTEEVLSSPLVGETYDVDIELGRTTKGFLSVSASI